MHKSIFHSDTLCPILAGMICICCLLSGCRMQARTEMFPSKEGYLITIGEDPTDRDTRWAKYLYEHLKKRANIAKRIQSSLQRFGYQTDRK